MQWLKNCGKVSGALMRESGAQTACRWGWDADFCTDETKNNSSIRPVKVPDYVIQLLKKYRLQQKEQRLKLGDQRQDSGRILVQWNGVPIHPSTVTNWFHKFICNSDLPDIHLHSMRHTNITLQIAGGIPITTVAARAGHANSNTTSKIYAHAIKSADEAAFFLPGL